MEKRITGLPDEDELENVVESVVLHFFSSFRGLIFNLRNFLNVAIISGVLFKNVSAGLSLGRVFSESHRET